MSDLAILPTDTASRNALLCENEACQICSFTRLTEGSVVRRTSMQKLLSCEERLPFTSRTAWLAIQSDCPDLRPVYMEVG